MTLSLGLNVARSSLSVTADQTAVVARNVAGANDPNATRKTANVVTATGGGVRLASITRASNESLQEKLLAAGSSAAAQRAIVDALDLLDQTVTDPELDASPAALVAKLADALQQFSAAPHDAIYARTAVAAAVNLADALNVATDTIQRVRAQSDASIADAVGSLNTLLARFEALNSDIVNGTRAGHDVTDQLDARDSLLTSISDEIGIRVVTRADNEIAIYTDSGVTLFDQRARSVTFDRTLAFLPGSAGNPVYVDGVPVTGGGGMPIASGRLTGLIAVRDNFTVTYQSQLDEVARGLIEAFAESDQSPVPSLADAPGLFTYAGAPAMPPGGSLLVGLAGTIRVSASVDPDQGGDAALLRDGGIAGDPAYVYNPTGATGYAERLQQLLDGVFAQRTFDPAAELASSGTLTGFASSSAAWLQEARRTAQDEAEYRNVTLERASDALTKITGVNLDEEMTLLLELERSYQASTKLISTIDNMFNSLLVAAG